MKAQETYLLKQTASGLMQVQGSQGCELEESVERALQPWKAEGRYHLVQKVRSPPGRSAEPTA